MTNEEYINAIRDIYYNNKTYVWSDAFLLKHGCLHLLPESTKKLLRQRVIKGVNNIRFSFCSNVLRKLNTIPYAVIKGAVLALHAYGNDAIRFSSDIDLLTSKAAFPQVKSVLISEGFVQGYIRDDKIIPYSRPELIYHLTQTHQAATFVKPTGNNLCPYIVIDVNIDIFWGESGITVNMDEFISSIHQETICSQPVNVLNPMEEFIALCLHHYKHMNSIYLLVEEGVHLNLLCDIYEYLKRNRLDPEQLRICCQHWKALPYVYFCVFYAVALLSGNVLTTYTDALYCVEGHQLLECIGLNANERRISKLNFWDRMFCDNTSVLLARELSHKDREKLEINRAYM